MVHVAGAERDITGEVLFESSLHFFFFVEFTINDSISGL